MMEDGVWPLTWCKEGTRESAYLRVSLSLPSLHSHFFRTSVCCYNSEDLLQKRLKMTKYRPISVFTKLGITCLPRPVKWGLWTTLNVRVTFGKSSHSRPIFSVPQRVHSHSQRPNMSRKYNNSYDRWIGTSSAHKGKLWTRVVDRCSGTMN